MSIRRAQVLDAAVRVLGGQGTRALTHRAVDAEGGLPAGTTSNYFRSRDALLAGILGYLFERETAAFETLAGQPRPVSVDELAERFGAMLWRTPFPSPAAIPAGRPGSPADPRQACHLPRGRAPPRAAYRPARVERETLGVGG